VADADPRLRLLGDHAIPSRDVLLIYHRDLRKTARIRAVLDYLAPAWEMRERGPK
jgi:hypothetical protein